jgi:predicted DNA-binding transcriptional regulator YafY
VRASRLLSIMLLLQTRGRLTARELADELEVSVRTIYRDVESLSAAGVPLYADRGPTGGYQLLDGYRTRLTGLTPDEADSLFLAGIPGPAAELGLGTVLAAAQLKLMAALPPELRSRAGRIRERFHLDAPGWFSDLDRPDSLATVADAVWNQRTIRVLYQRWNGEVDRTLEPLGIVLKGGSWYLVAQTADATQNIRTYRVSRILELEPLNAHFERPDDFDLGAYWQKWSKQFESNLLRQEVQVRLSPQGLEALPYLFSPAVARSVQQQASQPNEDGWVRVTLQVASLDHAYYELLQLGPDIEVLAPADLRERVTQAAQQVVKMYQRSTISDQESGVTRHVPPYS